MKKMGCFRQKYILEEKTFHQAFPSPEYFGRQADDVLNVARRFKTNIEALLRIYPKLVAEDPELFNGSTVNLDEYKRIGPKAKAEKARKGASGRRSPEPTATDLILAHPTKEAEVEDSEDDVVWL